MSKLKENLQAILDEKAKIKANEIIEGKTLFGVEGTLKEISTNNQRELDAEVGRASGGSYGTNGQYKTMTVQAKMKKDTLIRSEANASFSITPESIAQLISLTPDKIKNGETVLGVEGTLEEGIDTSDATAYGTDMVKGMTAYARGAKITGTLDKITSGSFETFDNYTISKNSAGAGGLIVNGIASRDVVLYKNAKAWITMEDYKVADAIQLSGDDIVEGKTYLGINGRAKKYVDPETTEDYLECLELSKSILGLE